MAFPRPFALLEALGWALLSSLWQFALLCLFFMLFVSLRKKHSSALNHGLALFLLSLGCAGFITNLSYQIFTGETLQLPIAADPGFEVFSIHQAAVRVYLVNYLPYISGVYLVVVLVMLFKFLSYFFHSQRILTRGLMEIPEPVSMQVQMLIRQLGIHRKVRVWASELVDSPMIAGFLKPTILIPVACINQLQTSQLEAILIHELAHVRRNDYLVNLFLAGSGIVFFFNPFAEFLINAIRREREHCCDDRVLEMHGDPHQYASALLALEQNRSGFLSVGLAATGKSRQMLLNRIQRILKVSSGSGMYFRLQFLYTIIAAGVICLIVFGVPEVKIVKALPKNLPLKQNTEVPAFQDAPVIRETRTVIVADKTALSASIPGKESGIPSIFSAEPLAKADEYLIPVAENSLDDDTEASNLTLAVNEEKRDFSIPTEKEPDLPFTVLMPNDFPFVPHSSFSFYRLQDTLKPGLKQKELQVKRAREAAIKAQLALEKIDWNKIQADVKNQIDIAELRKQIQLNLEQINWDEINQAVSDSLRLESIQQMEEVNQLRQEQQQLELSQEKLRREFEGKSKKYIKPSIIVHI